VTGVLGGAATGVEVEVTTRQWATLGPRRVYLEAAPGKVALRVPLRAGDNVAQLTPVERGADGLDRQRGPARTIQVTRQGIVPIDELGPRKRPLFRSTRDGSLLVRIDPPPGGFLAGRTDPRKINLDKDPTPYPEAWRFTGRRVRLTRPYYIGLTEVTWRQVAEHRGDGAGTRRELRRDARRTRTVTLEADGDLPAFDVDWPTARRYCERHGLRLPTDAEWELAASGGDNRDVTWSEGVVRGFNPLTMSSKTLVNLSWEFGVDEGSKQEPDQHPFLAPARSYEDGAAPSGCLHMLGNVWEWTADPWPDPDRRWTADEVVDPCSTPAEQQLADEAVERITRGGAWNMNFDYARTWYRDRQSPRDVERERGLDQGFRVAADVED
jgi:formylglycine-generating enzyme required for sulfatase activity